MDPFNPQPDPQAYEARRLRDLGYYDSALAAFDAIPNRSFVALEAAATLMEQGLLDDCFRRLQALRSSLHVQELLDINGYGVFPLMESFTYAARTGKFSKVMPTVTQTYNQYLLPFSSGAPMGGWMTDPNPKLVGHPCRLRSMRMLIYRTLYSR